MKMANSMLHMLVIASAAASASAFPVSAFADTQTILFIRHGEKPAAGLGQLDCRGLNRSLALPGVLKRKYGRIDAVFAPDPSQQKPDGAGDDGDRRATYDYVRPLATAEPTAIAFGLPMQADFGFTEIGKLKSALLDPAYRKATVLVVWEHHQLRDLVPKLLGDVGGDASAVPAKWPRSDFDSIWRVTVQRKHGATSAEFAHEQEGLDGQSDRCPS
jgi:hypothetical protein